MRGQRGSPRLHNDPAPSTVLNQRARTRSTQARSASDGTRCPVAGAPGLCGTIAHDHFAPTSFSHDNLVVSGGSLQQAGVRGGFFRLMAPKRHHTRDESEKKPNMSWRGFAPHFALKTRTTADTANLCWT